VRLEFIGALVLALCFAGCGGSTTSTVQATSSVPGLPTATSQPSSIPGSPQATSTETSTSATPTSQTALFCSNLNTFYQAITHKQGQVLMTMSIPSASSTVIHAALTQYTSQPTPTMTGTGYIVAPNDMVKLKFTQSSSSVDISITDTVTGTQTNYSVSHCTPISDSDLKLTGTSPASFTADIVHS
jgi:hypothetical protein